MAETVFPIRLDSAIELDRLELKPVSTGGYCIVDAKNGEELGDVQLADGATHSLELFLGKGGFMGTVASPKGILYFALPGSKIQVGGLSLTLKGEPVKPRAQKPAAKQAIALSSWPEPMQATILGAGLATRFERISGNSTQCAKPGVPLVGDKTVIECIANGLVRHGFKKIIVNTYFKPESIKSSLARSEAEQVFYIDEAEPSGTAGGLRKMLTLPQYAELLDLSKPLLVVQGDAVTDADFSALMGVHIAQDALLTIGCQLVDEQEVDKFGIIVTDRASMDGQSGNITAFQEKPPVELAQSRLANTGFYIFSPKAYPIVREIYQNLLKKAQDAAKAEGKPIPDEVALDFATDIFPEILCRVQENPQLGKFWAQTVEGYWSDIGNPRQYLESIHDIYAGKVNLPLPEQPERFYRDGIVYWDGTQEIADEEGAVLSGNVVVAKLCSFT